MHMKKTGWNERKRRMLALGLAAVLIGNTVDLSALPVLAMEQEQAESVETENLEQNSDVENSEQNQDSDIENVEEEQASGEEDADQEKSTVPAEDSEESMEDS